VGVTQMIFKFPNWHIGEHSTLLGEYELWDSLTPGPASLRVARQ